MSETNWFEENPRKVLASVVLFVFLACDVLLSLLFTPTLEGVRHAYYHHDLKKNYHGVHPWGGTTYAIHTNSLGFRDIDNRRVALSSDEHRILILGDSFVEGVGSPYEKTFVSRVAARLGPSIEVLNAGVRSYSPKLYYLKTKYLIEQVGLDFDELVVFIDISDIQDEIVYESFAPARPREGYKRFLVRLDSGLKSISYTYNSLVRGVLKNLSRRLFSGASLAGDGKSGTRVDEFYENYYEQRSQWTSNPEVYAAWGESGLALARENMEKLVALSSQRGIEVTIAVYPWPAQIESGESDSIQARFWRQVAADLGAGFIDYFPDFIDGRDPDSVIDEYFIAGDVHWTQKGHEIIAQGLLSEISGKGADASRQPQGRVAEPEPAP